MQPKTYKPKKKKKNQPNQINSNLLCFFPFSFLFFLFDISISGSDDFVQIIRDEATHLVDSVLEQSVSIVNSQQSSNTMHSESEHFAITCDVNGLDLMKSPTIESMSGKSFDDNFSVPDVDVSYGGNSVAAMNALSSSHSCSKLVTDPSNDSIPQIHNDLSKDQLNDQSNDHERRMRRMERIDRKFEKISSQLECDFGVAHDSSQMERDFDRAIDGIAADEISHLQRDFSKISWDDSVSASATTGDVAALTPDNDIQDLPKGD